MAAHLRSSEAAVMKFDACCDAVLAHPKPGTAATVVTLAERRWVWHGKCYWRFCWRKAGMRNGPLRGVCLYSSDLFQTGLSVSRRVMRSRSAAGENGLS